MIIYKSGMMADARTEHAWPVQVGTVQAIPYYQRIFQNVKISSSLAQKKRVVFEFKPTSVFPGFRACQI